MCDQKLLNGKYEPTFTMAYGTSSTCVSLAVLLHTNGMVRTLWNRWLTVLDHFDLIFLMGKQKRTLREVAGVFFLRTCKSQLHVTKIHFCVVRSHNHKREARSYLVWIFFEFFSTKHLQKPKENPQHDSLALLHRHNFSNTCGYCNLINILFKPLRWLLSKIP